MDRYKFYQNFLYMKTIESPYLWVEIDHISVFLSVSVYQITTLVLWNLMKVVNIFVGSLIKTKTNSLCFFIWENGKNGKYRKYRKLESNKLLFFLSCVPVIIYIYIYIYDFRLFDWEEKNFILC